MRTSGTAPLPQPSSTTAAVTIASVIRTAGSRGLARRMPQSIASETAATARARQLASASDASVRMSERMVSGRYSVQAAQGSGCSCAGASPRALRSWPMMIRMPAAARNPVSADCATYRTIWPSLNNPASSRISPLATPRASMMPITSPAGWWPSRMYGWISEKTSSAVALVGPVTRNRLEPNSPATIGGTMAA